MRTLIWVLASFAIVAVLYLGLLGALGAKSRQPRPTPGLVDGRLRPCPRSGNCACSEDTGASGTKPLVFSGDPQQAWARLQRAVVETGGMLDEAATPSPVYLHARYVSSFFGFVDDFEARLDPATSTIHLRSGSRVGLRDRGVNRRRLSAVRRAFEGGG